VLDSFPFFPSLSATGCSGEDPRARLQRDPYAAKRRKARTPLRLTKNESRGIRLEVHFAAKGCNPSGQSGAQEQHGSWLRGGAAVAAKNLESALVCDAIGKPRLATICGVVFGAGRAVAPVKDVIRVAAAARRPEHQPVIGAGAEVESRNTCDGDQTAARAKLGAAGEIGERGQHLSRLTTVVGVDVEVKRVSKARHIPHGKVNLADGAAGGHLKLVGRGEAGTDAASATDIPSCAATVDGGSCTQVAVQRVSLCWQAAESESQQAE